MHFETIHFQSFSQAFPLQLQTLKAIHDGLSSYDSTLGSRILGALNAPTWVLEGSSILGLRQIYRLEYEKMYIRKMWQI